MRAFAQASFIFSIAAIGSASIASPKLASAFTEYTNTAAAGRCSASTLSTGVVAWENGALVNNGASNTDVFALCSVVDSTALQMKNMNHISVDTVNEAGTSFEPEAQACVQDNVDTGATCGAVLIGPSSNGHHALAVSTSAWTGGSSGYPFFAIAIPGNQSALLGFSVTN